MVGFLQVREGKRERCYVLAIRQGSCRRAAMEMTDELKGENVQLKKENEEKENGKNTWELKCKQLEMPNRLLESKLQPQIIAEAEERRRRLLEATAVDLVKVYCAMCDDDWDIFPDWGYLERSRPASPPLRAR